MTDSIALTSFAEVGAPAAPPVLVPAVPAPRAEPFRFTGTTGEYFRIWIVNLFLTVVTLSIYSAWAKVRKKRYLYGNTWVAGANFEYHGNPVAILKGRLIAFAAFAAYTLATQYSPHFAAAIMLALLPAAPWLVVRSFAFNAVNSSYRNLRFRFRGTYREALAALAPFALIPLANLLMPEMDPAHPPRGWGDMWFVFAAPLIAMLVYPYVIAKVSLLHVNRSSYGTAPFECVASVGRFYGIYLLALLLFMVLMFVAGVLIAATMFALPVAAAVLFPVIYFVGGALLLGFTRSRTSNLVFNSTRLAGGVALASRLSATKLARIYGFNLAAIALTLGLAVPWAVMRTARYRAECLQLAVQGDLDSFLAAATRDVAATGDAMGEMFDVDFSL
jgi:uncharacterized membrane protein YjgN (DUF898 family)